MKLVYKDLFSPLDITCDKVNALIVENKGLYYKLLTELWDMNNGVEGNFILSENDKPLKWQSFVELIIQLVPFEINSKKLINKLYNRLQQTALNEDTIKSTINIQNYINSYVVELIDNDVFSLEFDQLQDILPILKIMNVRFDQYDGSLCEKLIDFMTNVRDLENKKLFIICGLGNYVTNDEIILFCETVVKHKLAVLLVESLDIWEGSFINKLIIDSDYCVF